MQSKRALALAAMMAIAAASPALAAKVEVLPHLKKHAHHIHAVSHKVKAKKPMAAPAMAPMAAPVAPAP